ADLGADLREGAARCAEPVERGVSFHRERQVARAHLDGLVQPLEPLLVVVLRLPDAAEGFEELALLVAMGWQGGPDAGEGRPVPGAGEVVDDGRVRGHGLASPRRSGCAEGWSSSKKERTA